MFTIRESEREGERHGEIDHERKVNVKIDVKYGEREIDRVEPDFNRDGLLHHAIHGELRSLRIPTNVHVQKRAGCCPSTRAFQFHNNRLLSKSLHGGP